MKDEKELIFFLVSSCVSLKSIHRSNTQYTYQRVWKREREISRTLRFVRILTPGDQYEHDVFVHQSNVHPQRSTYRTLRESETVRFNLSEETDDKAIPQVVELVGVNGRLYCDSRVRRRNNNSAPRGGNGNTNDASSADSGPTVADAAGDSSQWKKVNKRSKK